MMPHTLNLVFLGLFIIGCASSPTELEIPKADNAQNATSSKEVPTERPLLIQVQKLLESLGYVPIGFEFESDNSLLKIEEIFKDPIAQNRQITTLYTGMTLSYDSVFKALTLGDKLNKKKVLQYIQKNIPHK